MPYQSFKGFKARFDKKGNVQRIDAETREHFYAMLAAFLRAVVPNVPVWSGMARGSLRPLAKYITQKSGQSISVPISPNPKSKRHQERGQNIAAGEARGDFEFLKREGVLTLRFSPKVEHYKELDEGHPASDGRGSRSAPWLSFQAGNEAARDYREYVKAHLPRLKLTISKVSRGTSRGI